jgi:gamma-glutamylcyclotransferase (GGCT)/AIG2-like uncharacterized protein YtfP
MISPRLQQRDSLLFVYGTLRAFCAGPMARRLRKHARHVCAARVRGRLYDCGQYPGMRPARGRGEWVVGDVYRILRRTVLAVLDRYEAVAVAAGPRFVRRIRSAYDGRQRRRDVWVYEHRGPLLRCKRIAHGDYRRHGEQT